MAAVRRAATLCVVLGSVVGWSATSAGQDSATAEALFNKGVSEMEAGRFDAACPRLAESHRVDPRPGTMHALADCEARWNKVASAAAHYADYLRMVSQLPADKQKAHADRKRLAQQAIERIAPTVPQLTLVLPKEAPADTVVSRDGLVLGSISLGTALPVDPGEHLIVTRVPGGPEHRMSIRIELNENKTVQLEIELPPAAPVSTATSPSPMSSARSAPSGRRYVTATWVAAGVGVAGLAVWGVTGLMALNKKGVVSDRCEGSVCSDQEGKDAGDGARTLANVATAGLAVGAAGLATGLVLWIVGTPAKKQESARAWEPMVTVDARGSTCGIRGVW